MTVIKGIEVPTMVTINRASELTGVSYSYIRQLCLTKQIVFVKTGCKYLINLEKFVAFLNGEPEQLAVGVTNGSK
jgi:excisionase family DNA binding protein